MPAMPRAKNFGTKVAYKVMGIPDAILFKQTKKQKEIESKLRSLDTRMVR